MRGEQALARLRGERERERAEREREKVEWEREREEWRRGAAKQDRVLEC